jgi:hypothetical protein
VVVIRARRLVSSPALTAERIRLRLEPGSAFRRHAARARRIGLDALYLVLSFDCDRTEDADVAWEVHERLLGLGVTPVYAVPGELLEQGAAVYERIAATGSEFLNHGGRTHTYFDEQHGRHAPCFFYDDVGSDAVTEDIEYGHRLVGEVIGAAPTGFRVPHFGTYQQRSQLRFLHGRLGALGYSFSTSTVPAWGLREGPVFRRFGLAELPVSGMASSPLEILDTWSCFEAPDRTREPADFLREAERLAHGHAAAGPGLINIYGDPSHIAGREEFFDAIEAIRAVATPTGYAEILKLVR